MFIKLGVHTVQPEVNACIKILLQTLQKMFAIVKYGKSSSLMDLKVDFP